MMTDYSKLSDFEINCAVGEIVLHGCWESKPGTGGNDSDSWNYGSQDRFTPYPSLPDYCNSWADAGPILFKNLIGTEPLYEFDDEDEETSGGIHPDGEWGACHVRNNGIAFRSEHSNPLRAAMIVFLMMNEGE